MAIVKGCLLCASMELPQGVRVDGLEQFLNTRGVEIELVVYFVK